jgi:hypothetical protein
MFSVSGIVRADNHFIVVAGLTAGTLAHVSWLTYGKYLDKSRISGEVERVKLSLACAATKCTIHEITRSYTKRKIRVGSCDFVD